MKLKLDAHCTIKTEAGKSWLMLTFQELQVKERWPLHMKDLPKDQQDWFMERAAKRLQAKLEKAYIKRKIAS